jgi:hypothetical protein
LRVVRGFLTELGGLEGVEQISPLVLPLQKPLLWLAPTAKATPKTRIKKEPQFLFTTTTRGKETSKTSSPTTMAALHQKPPPRQDDDPLLPVLQTNAAHGKLTMSVLKRLHLLSTTQRVAVCPTSTALAPPRFLIPLTPDAFTRLALATSTSTAAVARSVGASPTSPEVTLCSPCSASLSLRKSLTDALPQPVQWLTSAEERASSSSSNSSSSSSSTTTTHAHWVAEIRFGTHSAAAQFCWLPASRLRSGGRTLRSTGPPRLRVLRHLLSSPAQHLSEAIARIGDASARSRAGKASKSATACASCPAEVSSVVDPLERLVPTDLVPTVGGRLTPWLHCALCGVLCVARITYDRVTPACARVSCVHSLCRVSVRPHG